MATPRHKMFIGGRWIDAISGKTRQIINPCNQQLIAEVAEGGGREDARAAIMAARQTFDSGVWSGRPAVDRAVLLYRIAELIDRDRRLLAELESLNTGKTVEESIWDISDIAGIFR